MIRGNSRILSFSITLILSLQLVSQDVYVKTDQLQKVAAYDVKSQDSVFVFQTEVPFSALVVKSETAGSFTVSFDQKNLTIPRDEDVASPTYFLSLPEERTQVILAVPSNSEFKLFIIHSGSPPGLDGKNARTAISLDCQEPFDFIPQSTWRSGLQAPSYSRSFHEVSHNVVHHSAGSNSSTNYTQVVRDIYLYHTQVNGWSDIGYNYLISQDGTIYAGRDPDGGSQDNVRGAHFCGGNSNTLGVCLLGNYETATPSSQTLASLEQLLTYQLLSQDLGPFETFSHSLGQLAAVVGHRDGCSTLCPGENVYRQLETLKTSLQDLIDDCSTPNSLSFEVESTLIESGRTVTFSNTSSSYDSYQWILDGAFPSFVNEENATVKYSVPGRYDVMLIGREKDESDTLLLQGFMHVSLLETNPVVFPNPLQTNQVLHVDFEEEIDNVKLFESSGKLVGDWDLSPTIRLPEIKSGLYLLTIESNGQTYKKKLLIE